MSTHIMIDHARRIESMKRRQQNRTHLVLVLCLIAAAAFAVIGIRSILIRINEIGHNNTVFMQCLNGSPVAIGDSILHCRIVHYNLVDLSGGGQP